MDELILASQSPHRRQLLEAAGVDFRAVAPEVDERAVEEALGLDGTGPESLAAILAQVKAENVSERHPGALVIGADQTLALGNCIFHKPADMEEARRNLLALNGETHQLHSAICLVRNGKVEWEHVSTVDMTMRRLDPGFIGRYLARIGDRALQSVGSYQIEAEGILLFKRIEGDHFSIVGLPMLPLLTELHDRGMIRV